MTIIELCEPLLLYVCRLNRAARKGGLVDDREVRREIGDLFADMRAKAATVPGLTVQFEKVELALMFFVDSMIAKSNLPFANEWSRNRIAHERDELTGDEKFYDILEEHLADRSREGAERLAVLYICLGMGFAGWYAGQPEVIRGKMMECAARLREFMDRDELQRICPEAYEHVDTEVYTQPPAAKVLGIGVAFAGVLLALLLGAWVAYKIDTRSLTADLAGIIKAGDVGETKETGE